MWLIFLYLFYSLKIGQICSENVHTISINHYILLWLFNLGTLRYPHQPGTSLTMSHRIFRHHQNAPHQTRHFYSFIREEYGEDRVQELKNLSNNLNMIVRLKNKLQFIRRCLDEAIFPKFLDIKLDHLPQHLLNSDIIFNFKYKVLKTEVSNAERQLRTARYNVDFAIGCLSVHFCYYVYYLHDRDLPGIYLCGQSKLGLW